MCLPENINNIDPKKFGSKITKINLCYTNQKRKNINAELMERYSKKKNYVDIKFLSYDPKSQNMKVYKGLPIIARKTTKFNNTMVGLEGEPVIVSKNDMLIVSKVSDDKKVITISNPDDENVSFDITTERFNMRFNPAYAVTVHCSQGMTIKDGICIHEWDKYDNRLKYVSISRCMKASQLNFQ
jgi:ATP-dependent exoDNAse (exonuclease V) alpha subunit